MILNRIARQAIVCQELGIEVAGLDTIEDLIEQLIKEVVYTRGELAICRRGNLPTKPSSPYTKVTVQRA